MVKAENRFHGTNSLNFVYRNGKTVRSKYFAVKFVDNSRRDTYRVAVVVSKKISKSAPVRNRIRRRLYELVRTDVAPHIKNTDIVITVFDEEVANIPANELERVFKKTFQEIIKR